MRCRDEPCPGTLRRTQGVASSIDRDILVLSLTFTTDQPAIFAIEKVDADPVRGHTTAQKQLNITRHLYTEQTTSAGRRMTTNTSLWPAPRSLYEYHHHHPTTPSALRIFIILYCMCWALGRPSCSVYICIRKLCGSGCEETTGKRSRRFGTHLCRQAAELTGPADRGYTG